MDHVHSYLSDSSDAPPRQHVGKLSSDIPGNQNGDDQRPADMVTRDEQNSFGSLSDSSDFNCGARVTQHPTMLTKVGSCKRDLFTARVSSEAASVEVTKGISDSESRSACLDEDESKISDPRLGKDESKISDSGFIKDETRISSAAQETCEETSSVMNTVSFLDEQASSLCHGTCLVNRVPGSTVNNSERFGSTIRQSTGIEELTSAACDVPSTFKSSCSIVNSCDNLLRCFLEESVSLDEQSRCDHAELTSLSEHLSSDQRKTESGGEQSSSTLSFNIHLDNPLSSVRRTPNIVDGMVNSVSGTDACLLRSSQDSTRRTHELASPAHNENGPVNEQCRSLSGTNNNLTDQICFAQEKLRINNEQLNTALPTGITSAYSSSAHTKNQIVDEQVHSISSSEDCNHEKETTIGVEEQSRSVKHNNKSSKEQVNCVSGTDHRNNDHSNLIQAMCSRSNERCNAVEDDTDNVHDQVSSNHDNAQNVDEEPSFYQDKTSSVDGQFNSISSTANSNCDQLSSVQDTLCIIQEHLSSASSTASGTEGQLSSGSEATRSCTDVQAGRGLDTVATDDDRPEASNSHQENVLHKLVPELSRPPKTKKKEDPSHHRAAETNEVAATSKSKDNKQGGRISKKSNNRSNLGKQLKTGQLQRSEQASCQSDKSVNESILTEPTPTLASRCCGSSHLVSPSPESLLRCAICVQHLKLEAMPILDQPTAKTPNTVSCKRRGKKSAPVKPAPKIVSPDATKKGRKTNSRADDSFQLATESPLSGRGTSEMSGEELSSCRDPKHTADPAHTEETASGPDGQVVAPLPALSKKQKKKLRKLQNQNAKTEKDRASKSAQTGCVKSADDAGATSLVEDVNQGTHCCGPSHKTNAPAGQNVQSCGKRKTKKNKQSKLPLEIRGPTDAPTPADNRKEKCRQSGQHPEGAKVPACSPAANPSQKWNLPHTVAAGSVPQGNTHVCPARSTGGPGLVLAVPGRKRPLLSGYHLAGVPPDVASNFPPDQLRYDRNLIKIRTLPGHFNKKTKLIDTDFYYGRHSDSNEGSTANETPGPRESNTPGADSALNDTCTQQESDSSDLPGTSQGQMDNECPATFNHGSNPMGSVAVIGGGQSNRHFHPNHFSGPWKQNRFRYSEPMPRYRRDLNTPATTGFRPFNTFRRQPGQFHARQDAFSHSGGPRHVLLNAQDYRQEPASDGADRAQPAVGRIAPGDTGDTSYRGPRNDQPFPNWKRRRQTPESGVEQHNSLPPWKRRKQTMAPLLWSSPESYQIERQINTGPAWLRTTSVPLSGPHHIIFESPASPESSSSLAGSSLGDLRRSLTPVSQPSEVESIEIANSRAGQRMPANYANPEVKCCVCLRTGLALWWRCAHVQVCSSCFRDELNEPLTNCSVCQILAQKS